MELITPASAHEVYVLDPNEVSQAMHSPSINPFLSTQTPLVLISIGTGVLFSLLLVWGSKSHFFQKRLSFLAKMTPYSLSLVRVGLGLSLIFGGLAFQIFGTEIALSSIFGTYFYPIAYAVVSFGTLLVLNKYLHLALWGLAPIFLVTFLRNPSYMVHYLDYLGVLIALIMVYVLGKTPRLDTAIAIARITFGVSVIYASVYAKLIHSSLALATIEKYHLSQVLPFDQNTIVLGAFLVETIAGIFILLGIGIRLVSLGLIFIMTTAIFYFGEVIWPHILLYSLALMLICYGYDRWTITRILIKEDKKLPVL